MEGLQTSDNNWLYSLSLLGEIQSVNCQGSPNTLKLVLSLCGMRHGGSQELRPPLGTCHSVLIPNLGKGGSGPSTEATRGLTEEEGRGQV